MNCCAEMTSLSGEQTKVNSKSHVGVCYLFVAAMLNLDVINHKYCTDSTFLTYIPTVWTSL